MSKQDSSPNEVVPNKVVLYDIYKYKSYRYYEIAKKLDECMSACPSWSYVHNPPCQQVCIKYANILIKLQLSK